ncbi:MAG: hypothetical protein ACP5OP_04300 [Leptospirillia bacterium]
MSLRAVILGLLLASGVSSCGLPSNPQTPPEVLVTALGSTTSAGEAKGFAIPFGVLPGSLSSQPLPAGLTLWGAAVADSTLILLARTSSAGGEFLLSPLPLSPSGPVTVTGLTGTPYALALSGQVVVVLETTGSYPEGCLQTFSVGSLISLSITGGSVAPLTTCQGLPGSDPLSGGLLLPMADGVEFLVGVLYQAPAPMDLLLYPQSTVIGGGSLTSPQTLLTTAGSYTGGTPLSGVALSSVFLLPDPASPAVDLYRVTALYQSGGGTLSPLSATSLSLPASPSLLSVDPAQNFLIVGSSGSVSLFGLGSVLSPPGTLGAIGKIPAVPGLSLGALAIYTGSS